jgi:mRNA interferase RelE/StbE
MPYQLLYTTRAEREIAKLPRQVIPRILEATLALASEPRPPGCKKLRGIPNAWRVRVGDYRILYEVNDSARVIRVARAGHRRDIYEQ